MTRTQVNALNQLKKLTKSELISLIKNVQKSEEPTSYSEAMSLIDQMNAITLIKTFGIPTKDQPLNFNSTMIKTWFKDNNVKGFPWIRYKSVIDMVNTIITYRKLSKPERKQYKTNMVNQFNTKIKDLKHNKDIDSKIKQHRIDNLQKALNHANDF